MNIIFSWHRDGDRFTPISKCDFLNQDGFSLLDCVLMDDGGLRYFRTIPWLIEGTIRIALVAAGALESSHWDRETWGVEFRDNKAKIYSLHDEQYIQTINLEGFAKALQAWVAFLQSTPDESKILNLSVDARDTSLSYSEERAETGSLSEVQRDSNPAHR